MCRATKCNRKAKDYDIEDHDDVQMPNPVYENSYISDCDKDKLVINQ